MKQPGYWPKPGFQFNPLRDLPRNMPCPCGSGSKFKKCCLDLLQPTVPKDATDYWDAKKKALAGEIAW